MNHSPACVSAFVDPHTVGTGTQILVISLFSVSPTKVLSKYQHSSRGGDSSASDSDEPLKEDNSENVEGTRTMKRTEMTK